MALWLTHDYSVKSWITLVSVSYDIMTFPAVKVLLSNQLNFFQVKTCLGKLWPGLNMMFGKQNMHDHRHDLTCHYWDKCYYNNYCQFPKTNKIPTVEHRNILRVYLFDQIWSNSLGNYSSGYRQIAHVCVYPIWLDKYIQIARDRFGQIAHVCVWIICPDKYGQIARHRAYTV